MDIHELLIDTFYFLVATLVFIPIFRFLKLGSMLGYILAGVLVGPVGLGLIDNSKSIFQLAEFGIILLLFTVGLELTPGRLKVLQKNIIVEGGFQMLLSTLIFSCLGYYFGLSVLAAFIIGISLSLSSTAFALSYLSDSSQLTLSHGQSSLSILLFQDLLIIPILALIPLLAEGGNVSEALSFSAIALKFLMFCSLITLCFFTLKPLISFIKKTQDREIGLAAFLFLIIGMAIGMEKLGLSMGIGSFLAGIFLANSEIKKEVKKSILPFKGILMGLFFMTMGMEFELSFVIENKLNIALICVGVIFIKGIILLTIGRVRNGSFKSGFRLSLILSQGGEFGLVVLGTALQFGILNQELSKLLLSSILITMLIAPFLTRFIEVSLLTSMIQKSNPDESTEQPNNVIPIKVSELDFEKKAS